MTDTIQKIAGDMLALAELLHDPSPEKKRLRVLAERLRALAARASAGEGGELAARFQKAASAANERANEHTGLNREWYLGRKDAFEDAITMLAAAPRAAEAEWLPIESAPLHGQFLVVVNDHVFMAYRHGVAVMAEYSREPFMSGPTHWRPLPAPPSAKGEDQNELV